MFVFTYLILRYKDKHLFGFSFLQQGRYIKKTNGRSDKQILPLAVLRRERDSNPRYLAVQRFSRPPQSTTLPSLQTSYPRVLVFKSDAKVRLFFDSASIRPVFFHLRLFFIWKQLLTLFNESSNFRVYIIFIFVLRKYG